MFVSRGFDEVLPAPRPTRAATASGTIPILIALACAFLLVSVTAAAQTSGRPTDADNTTNETQPSPESAGEGFDAADTVRDDIDELRRQLDVLADEVERLRSGETSEDQLPQLTDTEIRALGLAPAAARTYEGNRGVSIAGYGEMLFEGFSDTNQAGAPSGRTSQFDFLRAILYAGYRFNDKFLFNSEIEIEHADEVFVEFAYIDYLMHDHVALRGGMLLLPMGLVNEFHEPTVFFGAERPVTEQVIIPSTWRENGAGIHGAYGPFSYRAYVVNGLSGNRFSSAGIRGGRQKGSRAKAEHFAFAGRLDFTPTPGVFVGASLYRGGSGQGDVQVDRRDVDVSTTIVDLHAQAEFRGFDIRGLFAQATIGDALELNRFLQQTGTAGVGEKMRGGYLQIGYDVLSQQSTGSVELSPYYRWEKVDTQATMPIGFSRSLSTDSVFHTVGIELKPISAVVVKVDHMWATNGADTGVDQFNLSLGYAF